MEVRVSNVSLDYDGLCVNARVHVESVDGRTPGILDGSKVHVDLLGRFLTMVKEDQVELSVDTGHEGIDDIVETELVAAMDAYLDEDGTS